MPIKHLTPKSRKELEAALKQADPIDALYAAIELDDVNIFKNAYKRGTDYNLDIRSQYFMKAACIAGCLDILDFLFYAENYDKAIKGEPATLKRDTLTKCLDLAAERNQIDIVKFLLDKGVQISDWALFIANDNSIKKLLYDAFNKQRLKESVTMKNLVNQNLDEFLNENKKTPKTKKAKEAKFKKVMHHWKEGEQHIGKSKKKVPVSKKGQKQAVAIAMSMTGQSKKKD